MRTISSRSLIKFNKCCPDRSDLTIALATPNTVFYGLSLLYIPQL
jgi:hypothetical protein